MNETPLPDGSGSEKEIQISFGLLFSSRIDGNIDPGRVMVITNVGTEETFTSCLILKEKGKWMIPALAGGTTGIENIGEIIGQLTQKEVLDAYLFGLKKSGVPNPNDILQHIIEYSKQPPRFLSTQK